MSRLEPISLARRALPEHGARALAPLYRWLLEIRGRMVERAEAVRPVRREDHPVPPARLRHRAHGSFDREDYLATGRRCFADVAASLRAAGRDLASFRRVLDFGCGCGRTLNGFAEVPDPPELVGTDTDEASIEWCARHLPFASFAVNDPLPPLSYPDGRFDLVTAVSVFTHLDRDRADRWLGELARVLAPGGVLVATVHGETSWRGLRPREVEEIRRTGFLFSRSATMEGRYPEWYRVAYHTREHVEERWGRRLEVLGYRPDGMNGRQDVVVLGRAG
jgi:SAM-dependent methyltransferase